MYQIIDAAKSNVQEYTMSGTIDGVAFSGANNIVSGSCNYQNQCSDTSNFNLGYVYTGIFSATFINLNVNRNDWTGLEIVPTIHIGNINVPVGHFFISKADHKAGVVSVTAKDAMEKFKKSAAVSTGMSDTPYNWTMLACRECGVTFGMSELQVREMPNGSLPISLKEMGDIEDWIDVLYWVSQTLGGFATINREGYLVYRTYHNTIDDSVPADVRFNSSYGDEIITYTGLYVVNSADQVAEYHHAATDDGYNVKLGNNPFFQSSKAQRKVYCDNLVNALQNIEYNSCEVSIPFGAHYDLGDVLSFAGGDGDANNKFCVMYLSWTFNGECKIRSIPKPTNTMSKTDKNIQSLLNNVKKNEVTSYEGKNLKKIVIGNNQSALIYSARIASVIDTKAMVHIEVNLSSEANNSAEEYEIEYNQQTGVGTLKVKDVFDGVSDTAVKGEVTYIVNSEESEMHPVETWIDGQHVLHLMYILALNQGVVTTFRVFMKSVGGKIEIERGNLWFYATGMGLVGDGKWGGTIILEDNVEDIDLIELIASNVDDVVDVILKTPTAINISDNVEDFNLIELNVDGLDDTVTIILHLYSFPRITEDGIVRVTEDKIARYTEGD